MMLWHRPMSIISIPLQLSVPMEPSEAVPASMKDGVAQYLVAVAHHRRAACLLRRVRCLALLLVGLLVRPLRVQPIQAARRNRQRALVLALYLVRA